jgi:hypothetical protein
MTIQDLANSLNECVKHGTNPEDKVVIFDAYMVEYVEITGFTHGGTDGKLELHCDSDEEEQ